MTRKREVRTLLWSSTNSWAPLHKPRMLITILFTCNMWGTKRFPISWYYLPSKAFSLRGKWKRSCAVGSASESQGSPLRLPETAGRGGSSPKATWVGDVLRLPWQERHGAWTKTRLCPAPLVSRTIRVGGTAWVCCRAGIWLLDRGDVLLGSLYHTLPWQLQANGSCLAGSRGSPLRPRLKGLSRCLAGRSAIGPGSGLRGRPSQLLGFVWRVLRLLAPQLQCPAVCGMGRR